MEGWHLSRSVKVKGTGSVEREETDPQREDAAPAQAWWQSPRAQHCHRSPLTQNERPVAPVGPAGLEAEKGIASCAACK